MPFKTAWFVVAFFITGTAFAEDWSGWLGPRRDASTHDVVKPWKEPLKARWRIPAGGEGHSSPIVADGRVFLHTLERKDKKLHEKVSAYDADSGQPVWSKSYERSNFTSFFGNGPRGTPAVVDGKLYTFGITGILTCFDAKTGNQIWQVDTLSKYKAKNLLFGISGSPLVVGDGVLVNVGGKGAGIVAFDKNTGKELWKSQDDAASYSSPIVQGKGNQQQAIFLTSQGLVSVSPRNGELFWRFKLVDALNESSTTPVVVGDLLFGSTIMAGGIGLKMKQEKDRPAVEKVWNNDLLNCYFSTPIAIGSDQLYLVTGAKPGFTTKNVATLRCVDPATGKEHWKREPVGTYHACMIRTGDDKILLFEERGDLVLFQPATTGYQEQARSKVCGTTWAHPAIANYRFFVRDEKELVCVELPK